MPLHQPRLLRPSDHAAPRILSEVRPRVPADARPRVAAAPRRRMLVTAPTGSAAEPSHPHHRRREVLAGEAGGGYATKPLSARHRRREVLAGEEGAGDAAGELADLSACVDATIAEVRRFDLDHHDDASIKEAMRVLQRGIDAMRGLLCQGMGTLEERALEAAGPGRERRALAPTQQFGREELQLTPSEAKQLGETGRRLKEAPQAQRSLQKGTLRPELAKVITDTLRHLEGAEREQVEERLVEAAQHLDAVKLGRLARQLLAETDQAAAMQAENRRHRRRSGKVVQTADGMTQVSLALTGLDAELAHTAVNAFRRPDAEGEHRTPEQATADAFVQIFEAALRSREAPTQHGERPHLTVIVNAQDLEERTGAGFGLFTGPIPATELLRMARDAKLSFVVVDPVGVPTLVSEGRNVRSSALWRALLVRDGGCRWPGCDAPPSWCDVAHAEVPDRDGGPRVLSNVALLCRSHHRKVDLGHWTMRIRGPAVIFDPPDGNNAGPLRSERALTG